MDPQVIGFLITSVAGGGAILIGAIAGYKKVTAPNSVALGVLRSWWDFVTYTRVDERLIEQLRGGALSKIVPPTLRRRTLRLIDPEALKGDDRDKVEEEKLDEESDQPSV